MIIVFCDNCGCELELSNMFRCSVCKHTNRYTSLGFEDQIILGVEHR